MINRNSLLALAAMVGGFFLLTKNNNTQMTNAQAQDTSDVPTAADSNADIIAPSNTTLATIGQYSLGQKIAAFLHMIQSCEHVFPTDVMNGACYNIAYGGQWFNDMSDHPATTGDMQEIILPDQVCINAGLNPGCHSSAAGAYQIIEPTWWNLQAAHPELTDFTPAMQDLAAQYLLTDCGAVSDLNANNFAGALQKASKIWASLPGSTAQQNPKKYQFCVDRFNEGLAAAAAAAAG